MQGWEDDDAFSAGIGFADIIKRPTTSAAELSAAEFSYGRAALADRLGSAGARLVIFTFKASAEAYSGKFDDGGFVPGRAVGAADVFVMPGPYEDKASANGKLSQLRQRCVEADRPRTRSGSLLRECEGRP